MPDCWRAGNLGVSTLDADLERKARHYRELARVVLDEAVRLELEKLANEYESAARPRQAPQAPRLDPAA
jgi:hypothetical protein